MHPLSGPQGHGSGCLVPGFRDGPGQNVWDGERSSICDVADAPDALLYLGRHDVSYRLSLAKLAHLHAYLDQGIFCHSRSEGDGGAVVVG